MSMSPLDQGESIGWGNSFRTRRLVEFCETDAAGIAHFSAFFPYMEQAEHALLRCLGLSVMLEDAEGTIGWPRVRAGCQFEGAVKFEDVLDIAVRIERMSRRSVTYAFDFQRDGRRIASGEMTSVCCRIRPGQPPCAIEIPEQIAETLRGFMERGLPS